MYHPRIGSFKERVADVVCRRSVGEGGVGVSMSEVYMTAKFNQNFTTDSVVVRCAQCLRQGNVACRANDTQVRYVR